MLQKKNTKPTGKALAAGLLAAWMSVTPIANAAGPNEEPASDVSYTEGSQPSLSTDASMVMSLDAAKRFSIENNGIGIYVNIAPDTNLTHEIIGKGLVSRLKAEHGIDAFYTHSESTEGNTSVSFFVDGVPYALFGLDKMAQGYNDAVAHYKNLQDVPELVAGLN